MNLLLKKIEFDTKFAFIAFIVLISIKLWSFRGIPDNVYDGLEFIGVMLLFTLTLLYKQENAGSPGLFRHNVQLFILLPLISSVSAALFHDQSMTLSLLILRTNFFWLLYFVLHLLNIPSKRIIQFIIFIGSVWIVITVAQQFTYPQYYFYTRVEEDNYDFYRAGVYRFMIDQHQYGLFIVLYFYHRFLVSRKFSLLVPVLAGLVGYYYYSGRQYAVGAVACLAIATLLQKGTFKFYAILIITAIIIALLPYKDALFREYIDITNEQLESDDDVRILAAKFFLFDYWPHWITVFIGNGYENYKSGYGKEMLYINQVKLLFRSDVGIIGVLNMFGIFYVLNIFWLNIKGMRNKYFSQETSYLRFIFFYSLLLLPLSEAYSVPSGAVPFFCLIFYLIDKTYIEKQAALTELKAGQTDLLLTTS